MNWRTLCNKFPIEFSKIYLCRFVVAGENLPDSAVEYRNILIKFGKDPTRGIQVDLYSRSIVDDHRDTDLLLKMPSLKL